MSLLSDYESTVGTYSGEADVIGMLSETEGDIIIKTDADGFIQDVSSGLCALGFDVTKMLLKPHVADLAARRHMGNLRDYHRHALEGTAPLDKIIFPGASATAALADARFSAEAPANAPDEIWYSLSLKPAPQGGGLLGIMRRIERAPEPKEPSVVNALTDQLTGLPNRQAFSKVLAKALVSGTEGSVALIEIDHFRAITLRFGQSMGDEVIKAFAQFLTSLAGTACTIAHMESERFAVFLPDQDLVHALAWAQEVITIFAEISSELGFDSTRLTASAGVAQAIGSIDSALSRAELGVSVAKASGGKRTECGDWLHGCENAETIKERRCLVAEH